MDFCLVVPDSTCPSFVNSQLVSLQPVWITNKFLFKLQYLFAHFSVLKYYSSAKHFGTEISLFSLSVVNQSVTHW